MKSMITSHQNPLVKDAVKLRNRRERKTQGRILIDGASELLRALESGLPIVEIFVCEDLINRPQARRALELARARGIEPLHVTSAVFGRLAFGDRAEGLVAVAAEPQSIWPDLPLPQNPLVVVLEQVEKPGNLGGVVRTADAVGVSAVLVADAAADIYSPNAIRASLGTVFTLPVVAVGSNAVLRWLREQQINIVAARVEGAVHYADADYTGPSAIVLGSEARGLSTLWQGEGITAVSLPMLGSADSLNVSVTAAVLLYEALRQRRTP
ncbi:MAG: RNA methyltransferase [Candidatus Aminicenantes bacterium]|nr:RNA methyltransferase [Candidatus Aminicenantes bacterium]